MFFFKYEVLDKWDKVWYNWGIYAVSGAIIFDDTVTTPTADPIIGYIDFGGEQTQADGGVATISSIKVRIA